MDLHSLLEVIMAKGASDLHLVAGISPVFRIDGDLKMLGQKPLTPEEVKSLIYSVISTEKMCQCKVRKDRDIERLRR